MTGPSRAQVVAVVLALVAGVAVGVGWPIAPVAPTSLVAPADLSPTSDGLVRVSDLRLPPAELVPPPPPEPVIVPFEATRVGVSKLLREFEEAKVRECDERLRRAFSRDKPAGDTPGRERFSFYVWVQLDSVDRGVKAVTPTARTEKELLAREMRLLGAARILSMCMTGLLQTTRAVGPVEAGTPYEVPELNLSRFPIGPLYRFEVEFDLVVP